MAERIAQVALLSGTTPERLTQAFAAIPSALCDRMVENALGQFGLPLGVALNFRIDGRDYLVPMATEEPSVIAAASHAAKRVRACGGFTTSAAEPLMEAQIEVRRVADPQRAAEAIDAAYAELEVLASAPLAGVTARGGGMRGVRTRQLDDATVVVHLLVDCRDAMGANMLNTAAETMGPRVAELCQGELGLQILSNYCEQRWVRAAATLDYAAVGGEGLSGIDVARGIADASRFAELDPYRAVTHNKGILNGLDAVVVATGNDWRAVEAGAHAYASRTGTYRPLATWKLEGDTLHGQLELPLALGVVGGALRVHPAAQAARDVVGVDSASELARVAAAAGLASNLAALRALVTEGIQRGHMNLHGRV